MTRLELLHLVVARARVHGFEFRRWYTQRLGLPWINAPAALKLLDTQRRYYALLFSHEFAHAFWAPGSDILLELPAQTYESVQPDGTVRTIARRQHTRRSARRDAWRYHLKQMALAEEPLRYLRRFLLVEEQLDPDPELSATATPRKTSRKVSAKKAVEPPETSSSPPVLPAFLQRPYKSSAPAAASAASGRARRQAARPQRSQAVPLASEAKAGSHPPKQGEEAIPLPFFGHRGKG